MQDITRLKQNWLQCDTSWSGGYHTRNVFNSSSEYRHQWIVQITAMSQHPKKLLEETSPVTKVVMYTVIYQHNHGTKQP